MKSALSLVAFAHASERSGAIALLETALEALDRANETIAAAHVEFALQLLRTGSGQGSDALSLMSSH